MSLGCCEILKLCPLSSSTLSSRGTCSKESTTCSRSSCRSSILKRSKGLSAFFDFDATVPAAQKVQKISRDSFSQWNCVLSIRASINVNLFHPVDCHALCSSQITPQSTRYLRLSNSARLAVGHSPATGVALVLRGERSEGTHSPHAQLHHSPPVQCLSYPTRLGWQWGTPRPRGWRWSSDGKEARAHTRHTRFFRATASPFERKS